MASAARRGLLGLEPPRQVTQVLAVDDFGELPGRKRAAAKAARARGHQLGSWHRRPNDPAGRWNAFCCGCNRLVVVCTEAPAGLPDYYGAALAEPCVEGK